MSGGADDGPAADEGSRDADRPRRVGDEGDTDYPGERSRPPVREGREHLWRFLRTLVGLFLLSWLLAALFSPPDPFTFLIALVPQWLLAVLLAWFLVYRDGYDRLRASGLYSPSVPAAQALAAFVAVAVVLKVGTTFALDFSLGTRSYAADVGVSALALAVAYALVYVQPFGYSGDE
ncbi:hypothetical protein BRC81_17045 [Halobacteriales archaeon QS_1_68_20]|nr:MAG: hypothetical protein BRC81_17045 [Halobacteriales archaeon QS_1_68_20]